MLVWPAEQAQCRAVLRSWTDTDGEKITEQLSLFQDCEDDDGRYSLDFVGSCSLTWSDFRTHVDQSCRYSEEFVNIYYDCMDKKRRNLTRLYLDKATLVWNGNAVSGQDALGEFFELLPSSEFQVHTLDCQPVHEQATQGQTTLLVVTGGTVKFEGNKPRFFNQNFLLTAQASPNNDQPVWKIASDCFRFQDWNN
uniref:NTF2 domain-containing protein n=1 Tax=Echeneis naucrates TaxID=173247 RepID=A0A665UMR6_ECHNA